MSISFGAMEGMGHLEPSHRKSWGQELSWKGLEEEVRKWS